MAGPARGLLRRFLKPKGLAPSSHCMNLVRKADYENYMCTLLLPREIVAPAIAIRAFNVEIARIEDVVKDRKIGEMRLRFFMEELSGVFNGKPRNHPVLLDLHRTLQGTKVTKQYLKRLIEARIQRIQQPEFATLEAIEKYAESSVSPIFYMLLQLQEIADIHVDHYASHIAKAQGIVTVLRSIPYYASNRINVLPADMLMKHGLSTEGVFRRKEPEKLQNCIYDVASQAMVHLNKADSLKIKMTKNLKKTFLPCMFTRRYLERLRQIDFDVYDPKLLKHEVSLLLKLYWAGL